MPIYRCPECHEQTELAPRDGYEIVSVYCGEHRTGLTGQITPVRMELVPKLAPAPVREIVTAGAAS